MYFENPKSRKISLLKCLLQPILSGLISLWHKFNVCIIFILFSRFFSYSQASIQSGSKVVEHSSITNCRPSLNNMASQPQILWKEGPTARQEASLAMKSQRSAAMKERLSPWLTLIFFSTQFYFLYCRCETFPNQPLAKGGGVQSLDSAFILNIQRCVAKFPSLAQYTNDSQLVLRQIFTISFSALALAQTTKPLTFNI